MSLPQHIRDAILHYVPRLEGWTTPERCCEMAEYVIQNKPSIVVEIGSYAGRATISIAMALRENQHGTIYGIDAWRTEAALEGKHNPGDSDYWSKQDLHLRHRECMENIWAHRLEKFVVLIRSKSEDCHQLFPVIDLLFLDGNHSEELSTRDVELYLPKLIHGGFLIMDDCDWETTRHAQSMIEQECDIVKIGDNGHYKIYKKR